MCGSKIYKVNIQLGYSAAIEGKPVSFLYIHA